MLQNRLSRFCRDWKIRYAARYRNICPSRRPLGQAPPRRATPTQVQPASPGFSPGDARGEAPCIRKQKNLPLPVGKGVRGMGAGKYAKGKADRQQKGKPPTVTTPSLPAFPYSRKVLRGPGDSFKSPPAFSPLRTGKSKENQPDQVAARISEKALDKCPKVWYNTTCYGGIAQLVRAPR